MIHINVKDPGDIFQMPNLTKLTLITSLVNSRHFENDNACIIGLFEPNLDPSIIIPKNI